MVWNEFKRQVFGSKPKKKNYTERNKGRREEIIRKQRNEIARIKKKHGL